MNQRFKQAPKLVHPPLIFFLVFVLFIVMLGALCVGAYPVIWQNVFTSGSVDQHVLLSIRLPRLLLVCLVGGGLSLCGAVLQGLFRNPLADPSLIGISSGASLGAGLAIVFGAMLSQTVNTSLPFLAQIFAVFGVFLVPFSAFIGGLCITVLVYQLSQQNGRTNIAVLLLAGVALQAICGAALSALLYISDTEQLRDTDFWAMGSFNAAEWQSVAITAGVVVPTAVVLLRQSSGLNALMLSEHDAHFLGYHVENLKKRIIVCCALMVGVMVSAAGLIGFVGLLVPHIVRLAWGANHKSLLPLSLVLGMIILVLADTLARLIISPAELPIGIITALAGGPVFIYLLVSQRSKVVL